MNEEIKRFEDERKKIYGNLKKYILIMLAILVVAVVIGFVFELYFLIVIGIIVAIVPIIIASTKISSFSMSFREKIVNTLISERLENATYFPKSGIPKTEFMIPGFFKSPDRYHSEDYIKATCENVPFEVCDLSLEEREVTVDSQGHTHTTYHTYFKGRFMIFDYARDLNVIVKAIETRTLGASTGGLKKVDTESIAFNKKFNTYSSDPLKAFYILTPQMQEKMLELEKMFRGTIFYAFVAGKMYLAINDNSDSFNFQISKPIDDKVMDKINGQIDICPAVIKEFGLDKAKFNDVSVDE